MPLHEVKDSTGRTIVYQEENGLVMPLQAVKLKIQPNGDLKKHLENIRTMEIREDDVYVATYPKSGTHWIWEIISMLLKGEAQYEVNVKETTMLEFLSMEEVKQLPSPRILNGHYPPHLIPEGLLHKKCKIVHVMRNIKDVIISMFHHENGFAKIHNMPPSSLDDMLALMLGHHGFYLNYPWSKYIKEWEQLGKENPDQVLNISFEDMKKDSAKEVRTVATFLGLDCSDQLISDIAEKCSFQNLKQADKDIKVHRNPDGMSGQGFMYRKGEVGDWKNWITVTQNERIDKWLEEYLKDTDVQITYSL